MRVFDEWGLNVSEVEFLVIGWALALVVCAGVASWLILVMQAFFHDKRIGFACAFGGAAAALAMAISQTLSYSLLWSLLAVNIGFIGWFVARYVRKPFVYIPAIVLLISAIGGFWIWWRLARAGLLGA